MTAIRTLIAASCVLVFASAAADAATSFAGTTRSSPPAGPSTGPSGGGEPTLPDPYFTLNRKCPPSFVARWCNENFPDYTVQNEKVVVVRCDNHKHPLVKLANGQWFRDTSAPSRKVCKWERLDERVD